ncbi:3-hydroxyacyl-CoA dehydrogenase NAD-binding domain-containing protein [Corynebacterium hansenii]|uniref:3-hydroxyacyl-CoA dehydrogenase NAD-binding domain-containing protein n=1 Tax=Corynebacterium hansenii TaxID=394964 RepID=A0ABV7ZKJ4_9CORY|nr:3-hydroxyacyl-CoA dehydrogenase NAD-binding domain-containing protein [Corynebacterium hansenii]WJY99459.1 Fatty acid oxidation complex subunit alpha [Corynebacterium hansenii]
MTESTIKYDRDSEGIVTLTLDDPNQSANTMNEAFLASYADVVEKLKKDVEEGGVKGAILTSAKKSFFAGGDLRDLLHSSRENMAEAATASNELKKNMRTLETLGIPVVSAINGAALGGGLELALATHHRIVLDGPGVVLGLPEVTLGLLPGAGGVTRTVRMLGVEAALQNVLLQGNQLRPAKAVEVGIADELVDSADDLIPAARRWIESVAGDAEAAKQPWDRDGYRLPGGAPSNPKLASKLPVLPAFLRKTTKGAPYEAPIAIMSAAVEGAHVDFEAASVIESRYFAELSTGQVAKNMIRAFFFDLQAANALGKKLSGGKQEKVSKVTVLGAGMMGAAIAYVCAKSGAEVVLKDISLENAQRGKGYSEKLVAKANKRAGEDADVVARNQALLDRIHPTEDPADTRDSEVVIEAVFEDPKVKAQVFAEIDEYIKPDALLCSNTSTLPITLLAEKMSRPRDFIGMHFFSPVDKMPLVELIKGEQTSDETLQRALAVVSQIKKTPIVVNDARGFFTSRVIGTFTSEGMAMVHEGISPAVVEHASTQAGYPAPVLALMDELTLTLPRKIRDETFAAKKAEGAIPEDAPLPDPILDEMIDVHDRKGRSTGAGFYEYDADGKRVGLWKGLADAFGGDKEIPFEDVKERMLFIEAVETVRCIDEGVLETARDANVGSILGIGYPGWTGGVVRYMDQYPGGLPGFVARADELADKYGERFRPPASLREKAANGGTYEEVN